MRLRSPKFYDACLFPGHGERITRDRALDRLPVGQLNVIGNIPEPSEDRQKPTRPLPPTRAHPLDAHGNGRRQEEDDPIMQAMDYVAAAFERLPPSERPTADGSFNPSVPTICSSASSAISTAGNAAAAATTRWANSCRA